MGAASSKATRSAAAASTRKYPTRTQGTNPTTNVPSHPHPPAGQPTAPGPTVHPESQASGSRDESINLDASDPDFARSLRSLGPVQPSSTMSNSSTFSPSNTPSSPLSHRDQLSSPPHIPSNSSNPNNDTQSVFPNPSLNPALTMLSRRSQLAQDAEAEFARVRYGGDDSEGRSFLDVVKIREVLVMRDERKMSEREIERKLGLRKGLVETLGGRKVVREAGLGDARGAGEL